MNKAELTAAIVKKTGFTKKDAEKSAERRYRCHRRRTGRGRQGTDRWFWFFRSSQTSCPRRPQPPHRRSRLRLPLPKPLFSKRAKA